MKGDFTVIFLSLHTRLILSWLLLSSLVARSDRNIYCRIGVNIVKLVSFGGALTTSSLHVSIFFSSITGKTGHCAGFRELSPGACENSIKDLSPISKAKSTRSFTQEKFIFFIFLQARVCLLLLWFCRPFVFLRDVCIQTQRAGAASFKGSDQCKMRGIRKLASVRIWYY